MYNWLLACRAGSAAQRRTGHLLAGVLLTFGSLALAVAATKEVREIIRQIQAATASAGMATAEGLKETDKGMNLVPALALS